MKKTTKIISVLMAVLMLFSIIPVASFPVLAFNPENYKAQIKEIHIGKPITGIDGKKYLPVDVHFTATEDLGDSNAVYFLEGYVKATLADGTQAESVRGLGMTLMQATGTPTDSNSYSWSWSEGSGEGVLKYNVPLLENGETQAVETNGGTGLTEVNGLNVGDKAAIQIETVMNSSTIPSEILPPSGSLFSDEVTITIEDESKYPKTISGACAHDGASHWDKNDSEHWKVCDKCGQEIAGTRAAHNPIHSISSDGLAIGKCECGYVADDEFVLDDMMISTIPEQEYTGKPVEPTPEVKGKLPDESGKMTDFTVPADCYKVEYENNTDEGTGTVIITGLKGKSKGKKTKTFRIKCKHRKTKWKHNSTEHWRICRLCKKTIDGTTAPHSMDRISGSDSLPLKKCKCGYSATDVFDLSNAKIDSIPNQTYTGKQLEPVPLVKVSLPDEDGKTTEVTVPEEYYKVEYKNNIDVGKGLVIVIGLEGKSEGKKTKEFVIEECAHTWTWYNTDDISHYQYCTKCGTIKDGTEGAHAYKIKVNKKATCTKDAVITKTCTVCGHVATSRKPEPGVDSEELFAHHTWKEAWDRDASQHWQTCSVCGVETQHKDHTWGKTWEHNTVSHWQICSVCGAESEHSDHGSYTNVKVVRPRTCTENASVTADCGICGAKNITLVGNEIKALNNPDYLASGHDFSGPLKYDRSTCTAEGQGNHAPTCVNCGIRDSENAVAHAWTGLHTVSNGTCEDPNDPMIQEASCECGATLHIEKERHHVPVSDKSQDKAATCTEAGQINGHRCTICGLFYDFETVEALGHDFVKDDEKKADCETEGYIHYKCSRCGEEKTETIERKSANGQHTWVKNVGLAPTCLTDGTYNGEVCSVCGAKREREGDFGTLEALGHKVHAETVTYGRTKQKVSKAGYPMEITVHITVYTCDRCGARLGSEYWTVATASAGAGTNGSKYDIVSGKNAEITDLENGIHVNGNMSNDGGVTFNSIVLNELNDRIEQSKSKYQYKKLPANSFIIEFTDEFLNETEDGSYEVIIVNGSEYWPMIVTVKNHKLYSLADMEIPEAKELTEEEFDELMADLAADGVEVKNYYVPDERLPEEPTTEPAEPTTEPVPAEEYALGDVNRDGKINSKDARTALRISARLESADEFTKLLADVSKDGKVNSKDARLILRASAKLEDLPDETIKAPA